jgi:hypothetical protein
MRRTTVALALALLVVGGFTTVALASVTTSARKAAPADQIREAVQARLQAAVARDVPAHDRR